MDNDYLWDGSGTPDPDVERLERLLGRLRAVPPPLRLPEPASRRRSATATDLGCVYTLYVDDRGAGLLSVVAGWVAFELGGRESFVPAGASCRTDPGRGPGTPRFDDAPVEWREALNEVDFGHDATAREAALRRVLDAARPRDRVTLWHLISRVNRVERA